MHKILQNINHRVQIHTQQSHKFGLTNFQGNITSSQLWFATRKAYSPFKHMVIDHMFLGINLLFG